MCVIVHTCNQISSEAKARLLPLVQGQFGLQDKIQLHKTKTTKSNDELFFFFLCVPVCVSHRQCSPGTSSRLLVSASQVLGIQV